MATPTGTTNAVSVSTLISMLRPRLPGTVNSANELPYTSSTAAGLNASSAPQPETVSQHVGEPCLYMSEPLPPKKTMSPMKPRGRAAHHGNCPTSAAVTKKAAMKPAITPMREVTTAAASPSFLKRVVFEELTNSE